MPARLVRAVAMRLLILAFVLLLHPSAAGAQAPQAEASVVTVRARGSIGTENISLSINGLELASWNAIGTEFTLRTVTVETETVVSSLRVQFTNDGGWPEADKNVNIDYVEIDGVRFQSEASTTFSTGTYTPGDGCAGGFKQREWLHCNGYLEYRAAQGVVLAPDLDPEPPAGNPSVVGFRARGTTGAENVDLRINGAIVGSWTGLSTSLQTYSVTVSDETVIDTIRVHFTNDAVVPLDRNVLVDHLVIDGTLYQSEAPTTFSTGTYTPGTGCAGGFKQREWLHCNGYLEYRAAAGVILADGAEPPGPDRVRVIVDTDMGPDIDDALALAMVHGYVGEAKAEIAAVTISRNSDTGARYADLVNTFYRRPDIPIGVYRGTTNQDQNNYYYVADVVNSGDFPHDVHLTPIPEGYKVMRRALADAPDGSVVLVQIGYSTNTAALLRSGPDEISPLSGIELIEAKVRLLSVMGGNNGSSSTEFNIAQDVAAARQVFDQWPVELYQSEANLGGGIFYPLESILQDFTEPNPHVIPVSYLNRDIPWHRDNGDYYDMRTWDLTSVMAAVENPDTYFMVSGPGTVRIDGQGLTTFEPSALGKHRTLGRFWELSESQRQLVVDRMIELVSRRP